MPAPPPADRATTTGTYRSRTAQLPQVPGNRTPHPMPYVRIHRNGPQDKSPRIADLGRIPRKRPQNDAAASPAMENPDLSYEVRVFREAIALTTCGA